MTAIANKKRTAGKSPPQLKGNVMHADKKKVVRLLKTVQGQIQGLINMIEENRYCIDISTQILSSQSILKKVNYEILKGHFEHCIKDSVAQGDKAAQDKKIEELRANKDIIRNLSKIKCAVKNAQIFIQIQKEYGSFSKYIWDFTNNQVIYNNSEKIQVSTPLSDKISKDLQKRGMKYVGTVIIYSYLQAIGVINDHDKDCFLHKN